MPRSSSPVKVRRASFEKALHLLAETDDPEMIFRGQSNAKWTLCPSLFRQANGQPAAMERRRKDLDRLALCVDDFLSEYRRIRPQEEISSLYAERVALAQHYGVPTPALDWTDSALVALFIATAFWSGHHEAVRIYCARQEDFRRENGALLVKTPNANQRQVSQRGFLSYCVDPNGSEDRPKWSAHYLDEVAHGATAFRGELLCVEIAMNEDIAARILAFLARNRISFQTLFPDSLHWAAVHSVQKHFPNRLA